MQRGRAEGQPWLDVEYRRQETVEVRAAAGIRIMYGYILTRICTNHVQGARIMLIGICTNHGNGNMHKSLLCTNHANGNMHIMLTGIIERRYDRHLYYAQIMLTGTNLANGNHRATVRWTRSMTQAAS